MVTIPYQLYSKQYWRAKPQTAISLLPLAAKVLGYREAPRGWFHPVSTIKVYNLYWGIEGSAEINYQDKKFEISGSNFFFQAPDEPLSGTSTSDIWKYYWLAIDGKNIRDLINSLGFDSGTLYTSNSTPIHLLENLRDTITELDADSEYESSVLAYRLLLFAAMHKNKEPGIKLEKALVSESMEIIQKEFHKHDFDVNKLSSILLTHRSQITRAFRKILNTTPSQYLQDHRIKNALKLIQEKKNNIKEIAKLSGFDDPAYFTRCIKKTTGLTPRDIQHKI